MKSMSTYHVQNKNYLTQLLLYMREREIKTIYIIIAVLNVELYFVLKTAGVWLFTGFLEKERKKNLALIYYRLYSTN